MEGESFLFVRHQLCLQLYSRTPHTFLDKEKRIFAVLAGRPLHAEDWDAVMSGAVAAVDLLASRLKFSKQDCLHRRGPQKAKAFGFSHGGGQTHPGMLGVGSRGNEDAFLRFSEDPNVKRLTGFANCEWAVVRRLIILTY